MEAFADFCLFAFLNLYSMSELTILNAVKFSNLLTLITITYIVIMPLIVTIYICVKRQQLGSKKFKKRCGAFLEGTRFKDKDFFCSALIIALMYFIRRLLLCLTLVFWHNFFWG